jgi:hypothetical protein
MDIMARIMKTWVAAANLCIQNKIYGLLNIMPSPDQDILYCVKTRLLRFKDQRFVQYKAKTHAYLHQSGI